MTPADEVIGRTRGLVVHGAAGSSRGLILLINARVLPPTECGLEQVHWCGPVSLDDKAREHLVSVILPLIDHICHLLDVPVPCYRISISNPGAAASRDLGVQLGGFSLDVPLFLAMLSAALQLPVPEALASTSHIASSEGDIAPVRGLPQKIAAVLDDKRISTLILPDLDADTSLKTLAPNEYDEAVTAIWSVRDQLDLRPATNIHDAVKNAFDEEALVRGSLASGYFSEESVDARPSGNPIEQTAGYLKRDNVHRFWRSLEARLIGGETAVATSLLQVYAQHHLRKETYPRWFGQRLRALMISLPPRPRRQASSDLLSMQIFIDLSNLATEGDYSDLQLLFQTISGPEWVRSAHASEQDSSDDSIDDHADASLETLLAKISSQTIAQQVTLPLDEARARYQLDRVTVENADAFHDILVSFHAHMLRHTHEGVGRLDRDLLLGEALEILEHAFLQEGGYKAALAEATAGTGGGLRIVLDRLTEQMKREKVERHLLLVFAEAIDPLDWDARVELISALLKRLRPYLSAELLDRPPSSYAAEYKRLVQAYAESLDSVTKLLKIL